MHAQKREGFILRAPLFLAQKDNFSPLWALTQDTGAEVHREVQHGERDRDSILMQEMCSLFPHVYQLCSFLCFSRSLHFSSLGSY